MTPVLPESTIGWKHRTPCNNNKKTTSWKLSTRTYCRRRQPPSAMLPFLLPLLLFLRHTLLFPAMAQQVYTDNAMLNCYANNSASTLGYSCNGEESTCRTYALFRSATNHRTPSSIAQFLNASAQDIAQLNNVTESYSFPLDTPVLAPLYCSCTASATASDRYYQHDANYTLISETETYFILANDTYQGLTTCQALMEQNPEHDSRSLEKGLSLRVPVRCACPTASQIAAGYRYLLTYLVIPGDETSKIAERLGSDQGAIFTANSLGDKSTIYPYTTLLVPLKSPPTAEGLLSRNTSSTPPQPPPTTTTTAATSSSRSVAIAVASGVAALLVVVLLLVGVFLYRRRRRRAAALTKPENGDKPATSGLSAEVRLLVGSLTVYKYDDLRTATGFFADEQRIDGSSVYRGAINGDLAAVKRMKGDISRQVSILGKLNHTNLVRLSGFCLHENSTFLVFEFADKGSLHGWLHSPKSCSLGWRLRVQIALDVADGLNYLHNYAKPPCIHMDLNSSNVLLDGDFRAKISNLGLARSSAEEEGNREQRLQVTAHIVGRQGYLSPEYVELGVISPELDIFAFGVLMLELISGKEAVYGEALLSASIVPLLQGEDASEKLKQFVDPSIGEDYPSVSAFAMAELAKRCVAPDPRSRPTISEVYLALSGINSAEMDWDSSWEKTKTDSAIGPNPSDGDL